MDRCLKLVNSIVKSLRSTHATMSPSANPTHANGGNSTKAASPEIAHLKSLAAELNEQIHTLENAGDMPAEAQARIELVNTSQKLLTALRPPPETVVGMLQTGAAMSVANLFQHWGVFEAMPAEEPISFSELAAKVNVEESLLGESRTPSLCIASFGIPQLTVSCPPQQGSLAC